MVWVGGGGSPNPPPPPSQIACLQNPTRFIIKNDSLKKKNINRNQTSIIYQEREVHDKLDKQKYSMWCTLYALYGDQTRNANR
jgi:hypothetical protein